MASQQCKTWSVVLGGFSILTACDQLAAPEPDSRQGVQGAFPDLDETDLRITQEVRRAVAGVEAASGNAQQVKVITEHGVVTLLGPVHSGEEKALIGGLAQNVEGVRRIHNQLQIVPFP